VLLFAGIGFDIPRFCNLLSKQLPNTPMIGTTSCLGTGSERGFHAAPCVTALAFYGDGFSIGTGFSTKQGRDARSRGRVLAAKALAQANIPADKARFAFLFCSMGDEQAMLVGIYEILPKNMPILGGGAADNDLSSAWYVWNESDHGQNAAVLAVCDWPWELAASFESGYLVVGPTGRATRVMDKRILMTIDERPAAEVYNEWVKGAVGLKLEGGSILNETTLNPLGIAKKIEGGLKSFILIHPERILPDGSIKLFANIDEGEDLHLMFSRKAFLVNRTGRLAKNALGGVGLDPDSVVASVLIYCAGCLLIVRDQADEVLENFRRASDAPFIAGFTFGEVGCVLPRSYGHGNLMAGRFFSQQKSELYKRGRNF
jgi:hypothetical protein